MRVRSSRSRSTPAALSPTIALVGSSNSTYSPLFSAAWPSFDAFWILRSSSFCRQFSSSFIVSRSIHQERVVFLVSLFWIICDLFSDALVLTQVLHETTYCIIIWYTFRLLSLYFIFSHEFRSFNATSAKHHVNNN